jgi:hypothetical protein
MKDIIKIILNASTITMLFMEKDTFLLKKAIISKDLYPKLKDMISKTINFMTEGKELVDFDSTVTLDNTFEFLQSDKIPAFSDIKGAINNIATITNIKKLSEVVTSSSAYCFLFSIDGEKALTFRRFNSSYSLKNKIPVLCNDGHLSMLEENLFSFDDKVDCVYCNDKIYIFNKFNFETVFSYKDTYYTSAANVLENLDSLKLISNFESFKEECLKRSTIVKKFAKMESENLVDEFYKRMQEKIGVNTTIERFNLDIKINKKNQIEFEDISTLSEIVNLISDNYLVSLSTEDNYEVNSKKKVCK